MSKYSRINDEELIVPFYCDKMDFENSIGKRISKEEFANFRLYVEDSNYIVDVIQEHLNDMFDNFKKMEVNK